MRELINIVFATDLSLIIFYDDKKTFVYKVIGSIIYSFIDNLLCLDYLCLDYDYLGIIKSYLLNTIFLKKTRLIIFLR